MPRASPIDNPAIAPAQRDDKKSDICSSFGWVEFSKEQAHLSIKNWESQIKNLPQPGGDFVNYLNI